MIIFDSFFAQAIGLRRQAAAAFGFLGSNYPSILLDAQDQHTIAGLRTHSQAVMLDLFAQYVQQRSLTDFALLNLRHAEGGVPDVLENESHTIDGKLLAEVPDAFAKQWLNLTPFLRVRRSSTEPLQPTDVAKVCSLIVRHGLCASFSRNDPAYDWLPIQMARYIVESYSMSVALLLQRIYKLDQGQRLMVQVLFAEFYAEQLRGMSPTEGALPVLRRCKTLDNMLSVNQILERARGTGDAPLANIRAVCETVAKLGPERLSRFDVSVLVQHFTRTPQDAHLMSYALDYPPYWVYQTLRQQLGAKNGIITSLFTALPSFKREAAEFAVGLGRMEHLFEYQY